MSGAEALAVLGIIANVVAIVDFSGKAIDRVKESLEDTRDFPKAFQSLQNLLPLMSETLRKTEQHAKVEELETTKCKALHTVVLDFKKKLEDLNGILQKMVPAEGASKWRRGIKAISSLGYDNKVEEIVKSLESNMSLLTYYHVATAPTAAQLTSMVARTSSSAINATAEAPSMRKQYYMVPVQWSNDFTGRVEIMETLDAKLCQTERHSRVALVGLGGVGKTRIALQFAAKFRFSQNVSVFWMYAGNSERLRKSCLDIARKANLRECDDPETDIFQVVKEWFEGEESGHWLLIVDNADDLEMLYGPGPSSPARYFPRCDRGSILMTTRYRKVGVKFANARNSISVPTMSPDESKELLDTRLGNTQQEDGDRKQLTEELEHIPLALVQASSFISENQSSAGRYLQIYRDSEISKTRLLSEDFEDDVRDPETKNPVATTWMISINYISENHIAAAKILSLMSIFDSQAIPESLLSTVDDPIVLENALGTLQAFSLITLRGPEGSFLPQRGRSYDLHRLVRLAMRNWLRMKNVFNVWIARAVHVLIAQYAKDYKGPELPWIDYGLLAHQLLYSAELEHERTAALIRPPSSPQQQKYGHVSEDQLCDPCIESLLLQSMIGIGVNLTVLMIRHEQRMISIRGTSSMKVEDLELFRSMIKAFQAQRSCQTSNLLIFGLNVALLFLKIANIDAGNWLPVTNRLRTHPPTVLNRLESLKAMGKLTMTRP